MRSWWTQTLLILCMFICRLYLTEAGCEQHFKPKIWELTKAISLANLSEVISIVHTNTNFTDMVLCTIKKENKKILNNIWNDCGGKNTRSQEECKTFKISEDKVSFYDFMCLIAKVFEENIRKPDACTYDTVVKLHKKYNSIPTTTRATTTTTTQMSTTAPTTQTSTTTARTQKSTTAARTQTSTTRAATATTTTATTTKMSNTSVATVSTPTTSQPANVSRTTPSVSRQTSIASYSAISDDSINNPNGSNQPVNKDRKDRIVHSALGLSLIANLVLSFLLALMWSRRRSNHRTTNRSESHTHGDLHIMEDNLFLSSSATVTLEEGGTETHLHPAEDIL